MKKKKVKGLRLNKKVISSLETYALKGGVAVTGDRPCPRPPSTGIAECEPTDGPLCSWWIYCPTTICTDQ